jgi:hypothetical protein
MPGCGVLWRYMQAIIESLSLSLSLFIPPPSFLSPDLRCSGRTCTIKNYFIRSLLTLTRSFLTAEFGRSAPLPDWYHERYVQCRQLEEVCLRGGGREGWGGGDGALARTWACTFLIFHTFCTKTLFKRVLVQNKS